MFLLLENRESYIRSTWKMYLLSVPFITYLNSTHKSKSYLFFQDDLYLCSTKQPVATRKPLDGGYQDLDYRYLYKIPWPQLVGATSAQQKMTPAASATKPAGNNYNNNNISK